MYVKELLCCQGKLGFAALPGSVLPIGHRRFICCLLEPLILNCLSCLDGVGLMLPFSLSICRGVLCWLHDFILVDFFNLLHYDVVPFAKGIKSCCSTSLFSYLQEFAFFLLIFF